MLTETSYITRKPLSAWILTGNRFLVLAVGCYLAINGRLEVGALVAFLSA